MSAETVVVTPQFGIDSDGNPRTDADPVTLTPLAVAPGNTLQRPADGGELDEADFTVFLSLADEGKVHDDYSITVRGRECRARVQVWRSPRSGRGGVVVLARSATGKS